jgi:hypothetical protein
MKGLYRGWGGVAEGKKPSQQCCVQQDAKVEAESINDYINDERL